ncbi:alpha/beta hydrolase [Promicromonospora thailandica]|uniref:Alpha/beta hydrolase fold n=1 Tax=Promicromonospora thailandica TaxID=765201 RepID=A0A9X2JWX1_9MICO|nr:alpha/beta hydrolase [Promicromonospora thailandica]MCP2263539.1 alpha/beta hydrolase fold [Promicromonospora thailandica]BFF19277.1 alpha/beta hydrolase [Promicromonospora thailandica]
MIRPARRRQPAAVVATLLTTVLLLAACGAPPKVQTALEDVGRSDGSATEGAPEGFEDYYGQSLEWTDCGEPFQCATASAPLSWHDAGAGSIEIALKRIPATGQKIGSLLVNPGGPGGSGVEFVGDPGRFGQALRSSYDIVGFDPRGVGQSTPVTCYDDAGKDEFLSKDYPYTEAGLEARKDSVRAWGQACAENTGPLLGNVDTQSAARDMDMLRGALGDDKLSYLGYSYGTQLGATYAGLFPKRAGRLVLDGALDPTLSSDEVALQQAEGFESALRAYVTDCQAGSDCPLTGDVTSGLQQIQAIVEDAEPNPIPTSSGRFVTKKLAFYGVAVTMYDEASWSFLTQALREVLQQGTGDDLLYLADVYNDRNEDGTFKSNSEEAFRAINCADARAEEDMGTMQALAAQIQEAAPTLGESFGYSGIECTDWPYPPAKQEFDPAAEGAPPIVVVGTTNDPATPYRWAQSLAKTLSSAVLVTYEGEGHTAYGRSNACVANAVEKYLLEGTVPDDGLTC